VALTVQSSSAVRHGGTISHDEHESATSRNLVVVPLPPLWFSDLWL
jgi:hypothetical protein